MKTFFFFICDKFHGMQNIFSLYFDDMMQEFSWVLTMVTRHAQHCHITVTCPITAAKTIVIACDLPYQIILNKIKKIGIYYINGETTQFAYCVSSRIQFCMPNDLFTDLTVWKPRYELSCLGNFPEPVEFEIVFTEKCLRNHLCTYSW